VSRVRLGLCDQVYIDPMPSVTCSNRYRPRGSPPEDARVTRYTCASSGGEPLGLYLLLHVTLGSVGTHRIGPGDCMAEGEQSGTCRCVSYTMWRWYKAVQSS
jgi:hypothetical protein